MSSIKLVAGILISLLLLLSSPSLQISRAQSQDLADVFTESAASKLLNQVAEGLHGHSSRKMLGAFDLSRMNGGAVFKEQITAFFNQYESIRVHFKLVEVNDNIAIINAEMDQTPRSAITPPQHKSMELQFTAEKEANGWKFVDVRPRGFFL